MKSQKRSHYLPISFNCKHSIAINFVYKNQFIVAPGDYISGAFAGSDNDYGHMSGTSMAAPIVTGVIAILHDHWGHLKNNPQATAKILYDSATDMGAPGVDPVWGYGLLNIQAAFDPSAIVVGPGDPGGPETEPCDEIIIDALKNL